MTAEFLSEIGFEAQHFRIGMRMPPVAPRHIPISLTDFAADEQARMEIDLVLVGERNQVIELLKRTRIVVTRSGLEPRPEHIEPHNAVAQLMHLGEVRLDVLGIPLDWPAHRCLRRNPVRSDGDEALPIAYEIMAIQMDFG